MFHISTVLRRAQYYLIIPRHLYLYTKKMQRVPLRSSSKNLLSVPRARTSTYGDCSFSIATATTAPFLLHLHVVSSWNIKCKATSPSIFPSMMSLLITNMVIELIALRSMCMIWTWSRNQPKHRSRSFECPISFPFEKIQADKIDSHSECVI